MTNKDTQWCTYYQAHVKRKDCNYLVAILKSFDHIVLDRTIDVENSIFEFYVPSSMEKTFLDVMNHMIQEGFVSDLCQKENRLKSGTQEL